VLRRGRPALGFAIVGFVSNPDDWRSISVSLTHKTANLFE
jgi:hypothetical protein